MAACSEGRPSEASRRCRSSAMFMKKRTTCSGLPRNLARNSGFCVAMPVGQVLRWHCRAMSQPSADQHGSAEGELVCAKQGGDEHIAGGGESAVGAQADASAQAVGAQNLLRLAEAELPRIACVLDAAERGSAGAAAVSGDHDVVGVGLGDPGGDRADAELRDQLHADGRARIDALEVVDQLREVFDAVDVVMRRRTDERHAGLRVAQARDQFADLVSGKLAALAGLGTLGDLDLQLVGVDEVLRGHAEASGGDLLDFVVAQRDDALVVAVGRVGRRVFAALAGVGARAQHVHGDGDGLVRLGTERAQRHGAGDEALDEALRRLRLPRDRAQARRR